MLWGELDRETQLHGLATVGGIITHTGIAGLTLGGGIGWLMRKHGATVDNLVSVDLVTADGEVLTASEDENAELFWGVRGGGGNFGVVTLVRSTGFTLVGPIVPLGPLFHRLEDAHDVLRFYREFAATAPDELTTIVELELAPPLAILPEDVHGGPIVMVGACYAGPPENGAEVVRPLKEFGNLIVDRLGACRTWRCSRCSTPGAARLAPLLEIGRAAAAYGQCDRHAHRPHLADHVATLVHHSPARRGARSRARGCDRLQPARRRAQRRHQRRLDGRRPRGRPACGLGARFLRRQRPHARPRSRQLYDEDPTAFGRPTAPRSTTGWSNSNAITIQQTSSASIRTSSPAGLQCQAWRGKEPGGGSPHFGGVSWSGPAVSTHSVECCGAGSAKSRAKDAVLPPDGMSDEWRREAAVQSSSASCGASES